MRRVGCGAWLSSDVMVITDNPLLPLDNEGAQPAMENANMKNACGFGYTCDGTCLGYGTQSICPPLIVVAVLASSLHVPVLKEKQ